MKPLRQVSGQGLTGLGWAQVLVENGNWGRWLIVTAALWLALAVVYPGPMFQGEVFLSADSSNAEAFATVGDKALADGSYPLWNPYLFAGMPTFGSFAYVKYLYPPSMVFNFLQGTLGFPPLTWMLGHLLFGGLGMAWLLSRWKLPMGALVLGALVWILFPRTVAWAVHGHGSKLGAAMYLPWIVAWSWRVLDGGKWRAVGMTGLLLGLLLLRSHPQITYYTLLVVGWLGLWATVWPWEEAARKLSAKTRWIRLSQLLAGLALGFMIGGVLLLPAHDYSGISIRGQDTTGGGGVGLEYATGWSLAPSEMSTFVFPAAAGFGKATYVGRMPFTDYPNYYGILLFLLAAAAWVKGNRRLVLAVATMILLAVFVSFGNFGFGLYELLYNYLPFFNKFRIPSMILVLPAFGLAILAARGAAAWSAGLAADNGSGPGLPLGRPAILPGIMAAIGLMMLLLGATGAMRDGYVSGLQEMAAVAGRQTVDVMLQKAWFLQKSSLVRIGLVLLTAGAALWASHKNRAFIGPVLIWVLAVLVAMDLGGVNRLIIHPDQGLQSLARDSQGRGQLVASGPLLHKPDPRQGQQSGPGAATLAAALGHERVWPLGNLGEVNAWMTDGIRSLGGYHPAKLAQYEQIRKRLYGAEPAGHLANWLGAKVVAFARPFSEQDLAFLGQIGLQLDPQTVENRAPYFYRNLRAMPRARLMTQWLPVAMLPEKDALGPFLDGIQAGSIDYQNVVYLPEEPDPIPQNSTEALPDPVFVRDGLNEVVLDVETPTAALLLLSDMTVPGWQVEVDGQSRPLLQADLVLRAVALEAGKHQVRFHYEDPSVSKGLTLTLIGVFIVVVLLLIPFFVGRKNHQTGEMTAHE